MTSWRAVLRQPKTGEELALEGWQNIQITENFDGAAATIDVPGERPELGFITELVTNVMLYSDRVLAYQLRIMDAEDTFSENGHTVSLVCQSYESILSRRILHEDYQTKVGSVDGAIDQHEIAWQLVSRTQQWEDLGIRKATNWLTSTVKQDRIILRGKTVKEALDEAATTGDGFDWWIDANIRLHAQTPKLLFDTGLDLIWGGRIRTVSRSSASDTYDSVVLVTGATNETQLESGAVFPPPKPTTVQATSRPFGRWERSWVYGDLITQASVNAKAKFHLDDASARRAVYRIGLKHGEWHQTIRPGGLFSLRIRSLPRIDMRVKCRIEEISLQIGPSGEEVVDLGARAEVTETEISNTPQAIDVSPPGAIDLPYSPPSGKSVTLARVSEMDRFVALLHHFDDRISRSERT